MGAVFGLGVAVFYAVYILMLRQATAECCGRPPRNAAAGHRGMLRQATADPAAAGMGRAPVVAPLLRATVGATFGSAVLGLVLRDFRLGPAWPALGWLVLLALTSQPGSTGEVGVLSGALT
jgi:hypothetical protein